MKFIFFISVGLISLVIMSRVSFFLYSGLDLLLFSPPFIGLVLYIYAVVSEKEFIGQISAFMLFLNIIIYSGYGILFPLGGLGYSVIYCAFSILVFLPGVFISYQCRKNILGLKTQL